MNSQSVFLDRGFLDYSELFFSFPPYKQKVVGCAEVFRFFAGIKVVAQVLLVALFAHAVDLVL